MQELGSGYQESLTAPPSWWLMAAGLVVAVWWCFFVATPPGVAWVAAAVAALVTGGGLARYGGVRITTDDTGLHAGRAVLPWRHVGAVQVLGPEQTRRLVGVDADARAHLLLRTYCRGAVEVTVDDDRDPSPYWVVSTRRADELATHLRQRSMQD